MSGERSDRRETFERLFANGDDPWGLQTSDYERAKRDATLAALGGRRFTRGLEIGCATGLITERLAPWCDDLFAMDISQTALERARARLAGHRSVRFIQGEVPSYWPSGSFDLIVLSEVLYFLSREEIGQVARASWRSLQQGGVCLLVNWTGANDLPVGGSEAVALFGEARNWRLERHRAEETYRIDCFSKPLL